MNTEKQYTQNTKQAAKMFGIERESFRIMYAPFIDRKKIGRENFYNLEDLNELFKKKRKWVRKN